MKEEKLDSKKFVISGVERNTQGIIIIDDDWRERMQNCNDMIDPEKNPPNKKREEK